MLLQTLQAMVKLRWSDRRMLAEVGKWVEEHCNDLDGFQVLQILEALAELRPSGNAGLIVDEEGNRSSGFSERQLSQTLYLLNRRMRKNDNELISQLHPNHVLSLLYSCWSLGLMTTARTISASSSSSSSSSFYPQNHSLGGCDSSPLPLAALYRKANTALGDVMLSDRDIARAKMIATARRLEQMRLSLDQPPFSDEEEKFCEMVEERWPEGLLRDDMRDHGTSGGIVSLLAGKDEVVVEKTIGQATARIRKKILRTGVQAKINLTKILMTSSTSLGDLSWQADVKVFPGFSIDALFPRNEQLCKGLSESHSWEEVAWHLGQVLRT